MRDATPVSAFLFSIEELVADEHPYNRAPQRAVVQALSRRGAGVRSLIASGDLILERIARRLTSVSGDGDGGPLGARVGPRASYSLDRALHMTLVWDLCDTVAEQPHDLDLDRLASVLMRHDAFVITVTEFGHETILAASETLNGRNGYLGCMPVDLGNPVQQQVMIVPRVGYLLDGALVFDPWDTDRPEDPYPLADHPDGWWEGLELAGVRYLRPQELDAPGVLPGWPDVPLSRRGAETAAMLARRTAKSHLDRLASEIANRQTAGPWSFAIDTALMPRASDAIIEASKLAGYALNPEHPTGRHKAVLFADVLGITAQDAAFLAAQLKRGLASAGTLTSVRTDEWGVKYHVVVDVTGRNGEVRPVIAAWEVRDAEPPRLITAFLADPGTASDAPDGEAAVDPALAGSDRWAALWSSADAAGSRASERCVPTPISIDGEWIRDGLHGGAYIVLGDARTGFARWLVREGHASGDGRPGARITVWGFDRGKAYAEAFADVLALNGVDSKVSEFLT